MKEKACVELWGREHLRVTERDLGRVTIINCLITFENTLAPSKPIRFFTTLVGKFKKRKEDLKIRKDKNEKNK